MENNISDLEFLKIDIDNKEYQINKTFQFENKFYFSRKRDEEESDKKSIEDLEMDFFKEDLTSIIREVIKEKDYELSNNIKNILDSEDKIIGEYYYAAFKLPINSSTDNNVCIYIKVKIENLICTFKAKIKCN